VPRATITLVTRSVGGKGGALWDEQHSGLIVELAGEKAFIVEGGQRAGKIVGGLRETARPFTDFGQAKGADWDQPDAVRTLAVSTIETFELVSITEDDLRAAVEDLNRSLDPYSYTFVAACLSCGPNSNSYVARFLGALGLWAPPPAHAVGWTWSPDTA
jgi:hypothetical protein